MVKKVNTNLELQEIEESVQPSVNKSNSRSGLKNTTSISDNPLALDEEIDVDSYSKADMVKVLQELEETKQALEEMSAKHLDQREKASKLRKKSREQKILIDSYKELSGGNVEKALTELNSIKETLGDTSEINLEELVKSKGESEALILKLQQELDEAKKYQSDITNKFNHSETELTVTKVLVEEKDQLINQLKFNENELKKVNKELDGQLIETMNKLEEKDKQLSEMSQQLESFGEVKVQLEEVNKQFKDLQQNFSHKENSYNELQEQYLELEIKFEESGNTIAVFKNKLTNLEEVSTTSAVQENEVKNLTEQLKAIKDDLDKAHRDMEEMSKESVKNKEIADNMTRKFNELQTKHTVVMSEVSDLKFTEESLNKKLNEFSKKETNYISSLEEMSVQLERMEESVRYYKEQYNLASSKSVENSNKLIDAEKLIDELQTKLNGMSLQQVSDINERKKLDSTIAELNATIEGYKEQLLNVEMLESASKSKMTHLEKQLSKSETKVKELSKQLEETKNNIKLSPEKIDKIRKYDVVARLTEYSLVIMKKYPNIRKEYDKMVDDNQSELRQLMQQEV